jgi:prepilin-type N-terminal cleavage/methylation domain-containing protein
MKNEKGITLIELLAAISILVIISSLIYGVLIGVNKNYNQLSSKTNLNQEANIILATLKNYHIKDQYHDVNGKYMISYNATAQKAYIGTTKANIPLQKDNLKIELKIDNIEFTGEKSIPSSRPLNIYIKLLDPKGQFYEIETSIKRY